MKLPKTASAAAWLVALSLTAAGVAFPAAKDNPEGDSAPVALNVAAVDSHGQPVSGLRAEGFQILDNGKPRQVVWLRALSGALSNGGPSPAVFILIDLYNADLEARGLTANEVVRALEHLDSGGSVYLYLLTPAATIVAVRGVDSPQDDHWTQRVKPMLDEALRKTNGLKSGDSLYADLRIGPTWQATANLATQIAQVPGPKSLVWITQGVENGFWQPGHQFVRDTKYLRNFAALLSALQTAIYTVQQRPSGSLELDNEGSGGETLHQLSALTGGRYYTTDKTDEAIAEGMSGAQSMNYRMAFLPDRLDGKYHKLRVTTARTDVRIQTAQNYYASKPDLDQLDAGMISAIGASPFDYPEIGVKATPAKVEGSPGEYRFAIHVAASDVVFLKEGALYKARLVVELVEYGANGQRSVTGGIPDNLDLNEEQHAKVITDGIDIVQPTALDDSVRQVRIAVVDRTSNLAGTVTMPMAGK
jgi:VWFA-related protein